MMRETFEYMLDELLSTALVVVVDHGSKCRKVLSYNCDWYSDMCHQYGTMRKRKNGVWKWETHVKRRYIIILLHRLIQGETPPSKWASRLTAAAIEYDKIMEEYNKSEYEFLRLNEE